MEYVEGETLKQLIARQPLALRTALDIAIQVCSGLAAAHKRAVVHRDIKSDNILVTPEGDAKITDFGLAKLQGATRVTEEPLPIPRFNDQVSPDLERIVSKALAKDRDERYQHADDLLADLKRERRHLDLAHTGPKPIAPAAGPQPTEPSAAQQRTAPPVAKPPMPRWQTPTARLMRFPIPAATILVLVLLLVLFNPFNLQVSQITSEAAEQAPSLAVLYFQNIPDPVDKTHVGDMLTDLLITALSQDKSLQVVSRERLYDIQKDMGREDAKAISPADAARLAERAGVSMMLLGSILQQEPSLVITALKRAVEIDSNFAMAYFSLGQRGVADQVTRGAYLQKAWELRDRVTEKERFRIESSYMAEVVGDRKKAAEMLETFLQKYPHEVASYVELAVVYTMMGRPDKALGNFQRAVQRDSLDKHVWNDLAYSLAGFNRKEEAIRAVNKYLEMLPGEPNPLDSKGDIFLAFGELDSAAAYFKKAVSLRPDFPSAKLTS